MLQVEYEGFGITVGELKKITDKYDIDVKKVKLESKNYKYFEKEFPYPVVDIILIKKISKAGCYKKGEAIIPTYGIKPPNKVWVSRGCRGIFEVILKVPKKEVIKKPVKQPVKKPVEKPVSKPPISKVIKKVQPIVKKPIQEVIKKPVKQPITKCPPNTRCVQESGGHKQQHILQSITERRKEVLEILEKHKPNKPKMSTGYPAKRVEVAKPIQQRPVISQQIHEKVEVEDSSLFKPVTKTVFNIGTSPIKEEFELVEETEIPKIQKLIKKQQVEEQKKEDKLKEILPILAIGGLALLLLGGGESV